MDPVKIILQGLFYTLFCWSLYFFSTSPSYSYLQPGQAEVRVAFPHAGETVEPCRTRTPEELKKLPSHMRLAKSCPRERSPLIITLALDDQEISTLNIPPSGVHGDGMAFVYAKFPVPAGRHTLEVKMDDSVRDAGFNYHERRELELVPGQALIIGFNPESKTFYFH